MWLQQSQLAQSFDNPTFNGRQNVIPQIQTGMSSTQHTMQQSPQSTFSILTPQNTNAMSATDSSNTMPPSHNIVHSSQNLWHQTLPPTQNIMPMPLRQTSTQNMASTPARQNLTQSIVSTSSRQNLTHSIVSTSTEHSPTQDIPRQSVRQNTISSAEAILRSPPPNYTVDL